MLSREITTVIFFIFFGYLLGSLPTGYLVGKVFKGIDLREYGSKNIGATNVLRTLGRTAALFTLFIDCAKGFIPVVLAKQITNQSGAIPIIAGAASIIGHTWTIFLRFRGGKGVATTFGVFLGLLPLPTVLALVLFLVIVILTGYVSLGSISVAVIYPIITWFFEHSLKLTVFTVAIAILIVVRHSSNIHRLIQGKENKLILKTIQTR